MATSSLQDVPEKGIVAGNQIVLKVLEDESVMTALKETPTSELKRLRKEHEKTLRDEIFGGLSASERAAYDARAGRIHQLAIEIEASAAVDDASKAAKAQQRVEWNKEAEIDTPQGEARQPYRSRENDSANSSAKRAKATSTNKIHKSE